MKPGDIINIDGEGVCTLKKFLNKIYDYEIWIVEFEDRPDEFFNRMIKTD